MWTTVAEVGADGMNGAGEWAAVYSSPSAAALLTAGLDDIRRTGALPGEFSAEVLAQADAAVTAGVDRVGRVDLTDEHFATLDPATSTDLDQAFALTLDADTFVLRYAIADVGAVVPRGSVLEAEAWKRASTLYLPDEKIPQYPRQLSEGTASLLPNVDRAAIVLTVSLGPDLVPVLRGVERAVVRSKAKLAYETCSPSDAHPLLASFAARMAESDQARGAERVQRPEQEIEHDPAAPGELILRFRSLTESERANAAMSLAANLAVAALFVARGVGLFRDLDNPNSRDVASLRRTAKALGLAWSDDEELRDVLRRLRPDDPIDATFSLAVRRAGGGAVYRMYRPTGPGGELRSDAKTGAPAGPWHAAMGAPYAHATAPLRRLADRYVLDLAVALMAGVAVSVDDAVTLDRLPPVMAAVGSLASRVERDCIDLVEAVTLLGRDSEVFDGVVAEDAGPTSVVHLMNEGIRIRLKLADAVAGDAVRLRLVTADPAKRTLTFELIQPVEPVADPSA